jgi:hypothetical protein
MTASRFNDPIEPTTIANMRESGVRSLAFRCHRCHHERTLNVDHLPGDLTFPTDGVHEMRDRRSRRQAGLAGAGAAVKKKPAARPGLVRLWAKPRPR